MLQKDANLNKKSPRNLISKKSEFFKIKFRRDSCINFESER